MRKYAEFSGMIEKMSAKREDLRLAGAGSEITGTFDREIDSLMKQRKAIEGQTAPLDKLRKKMEELQRQGEIMQLERDIKFDPQLRALDEEKAKLDDLESGYRDIASAVRDLEASLSEMASASSRHLSAVEAAKKKSEASDAVQRFQEAGLGDFAAPSGSAPPGLGREGGLQDILDFNKQMEEELNKALADMGGFDLFAPLKQQWNDAWSWIKEKTQGLIQPVWDKVTSFFDGKDFGFGDGIDLGNLFKGDFDFGFLDNAIQSTRDGLNDIGNAFSETWGDITGEIGPVFDTIVESVGGFISGITDELSNWAPLWGELVSAVSKVWDAIYARLRDAMQVLRVVMYGGLGALRVVWEAFWPILRNSFEAVWNALTGIVRGVLEMIRGIITAVLALINGDWQRFGEGILTFFDGLWDTLYAIFRYYWDLIYGIVKGAFEGIISAGQWLYDTVLKDLFEPLGDALKKIFEGIKNHISTAWDNTWKAVKWAWDNLANPIWMAVQWTVEHILIPLFERFKLGVERIWNAIGTAIKWVWNSIIKPVWDAIKWTIDHVLAPLFERFKTGLERNWNAIGTVVKWIWNNILKPIWNTIMSFINDKLAPKFHWLAGKVGDAFSAISSMASTIWNSIIGIIGGAVNIVIDIINKLIDGINLLSNLPGITIHIDHVNHVSWGNVGGGGGGGNPNTAGVPLAAGTNRIPDRLFNRQVGSGFKTNNVRAIVGEGNPLYPEYVIPTDPTHRNRAVNLAQSLMGDLGLHPQFAFGGIIDTIGDAWDATGGKVVSGIKKGAIMGIINPVNEIAKHMINMIPVDFIREAANSARQIVYDWATNSDNKVPEVPEITGGGMGTWVRMWAALKDAFPAAQLFSSMRPGAITATGNLSYHSRGRAIDVTPSMSIFDWIHENYPNSRELIYSPANGRQIRNGAPHFYSSVIRADHWDHVHWAMQNGGIIPSLANGGIINPTPGGTLVRLGEAGRREAVQPLPRDFQTGRTINFYGDLSFPNITDPNDAETFINNLEALV